MDIFATPREVRDLDLRFLGHVHFDKDDHWLWRGHLSSSGYATKFSVGGESVRPHRWAYERWLGPIATGLWFSHDLSRGCPRHCVNPFHALEPMTPKEQAEQTLRDGNNHNANKALCPECGGPLTVNKGGHRRCKSCQIAYQKGYRERNRARVREWERQGRERNRDKINERQRARRARA